MKKATNLEGLRKELSEADIQMMVTEYMMETIAKAQKYDRIKALIDSGASLKTIKEEI